MLSLKVNLLIIGTAFVAGFVTGYSFRSEKAELERMEANQYALEEENRKLIKQLEIEHEYQETAKAKAEQAQNDLAELENRYADAVNELNDLQLYYSTESDSDETALSEDSGFTNSVPEGKSKCPGYNQREFQKLYESQLKVAKDCDITANYYNRLIELYESISENR